MATASQTPSGWYGLTLGPPIFVDQQAAGGQGVVADHLGVHPEPRAAREQPVLRVLLELLGRRSRPTGGRSADVTSSLKNRFTSQPDSRNSTASQSSSSGCDGSSPLTPKSPAVRTRPVPKSSCQKRLTVTRAVSGCSGRSSHCAKPRRFVRQVGGQRRAGRRACPASPGRGACRTRRG